MTAAEVAAWLKGKKSGAGWQARCPAHDDQRASLSIGVGGDGRVLLKDHAGCSIEAILTAARLEASDLFPTTQASPEKHITATYDYVDEAGVLLYQVVRYVPKDFRQRRADGAWSMKGVRRVLFGLPNLKNRKVVYIPEGEKDVLRLRSVGLVATTNAGGAGKWRDEYVEQLREAGVEAAIVIPDNDATGKAHAAAVGRSCRGAGLIVTVLDLPDLRAKGDVSDWLDAGHTRDDLEALVERAGMGDAMAGATDFTGPTAATFRLPLTTPQEIAAMTEERAVSFAPYIMKGAITEIDAYAKRGKTSFVLYEIGCIVFGVDCLGQPTVSTGVVYLTEERKPTLRRALARTGLLNAPRLRIVSRWDLPADLSWPATVEAAWAACTETDSQVLVVDTLPQWARLRGDTENNAGDALAALEPLQRAAAGGLAVVITRHDRKGGGVVGESGRGSSAFAGAVDTIVSLRKPEGKSPPTQRLLEAISRFDEIPEAMVIERTVADSDSHVPMGSRFEKNLYRVLGEPGQLAVERAEAAILTILPTERRMTVKALTEALSDIAPTTLGKALDSLRGRGEIDRTGAGKKKNPHVYFRSVCDSPQTSNPRGRDEKKASLDLVSDR
jgi:putative DNA primase/helicase